jgi:hypothetical protein
MLSSDLWHHVGFVRTDYLEDRVASIFRVGKISELGTVLAVTSRLKTRRRNTNYMRREGTGVGYREPGGGRGFGLCIGQSG